MSSFFRVFLDYLWQEIIGLPRAAWRLGMLFAMPLWYRSCKRRSFGGILGGLVWFLQAIYQMLCLMERSSGVLRRANTNTQHPHLFSIQQKQNWQFRFFVLISSILYTILMKNTLFSIFLHQMALSNHFFALFITCNHSIITFFDIFFLLPTILQHFFLINDLLLYEYPLLLDYPFPYLS